MNIDRFDAPGRLAELLQAWHAMSPADKAGEAGRAVLAEIRGMGQAAAYFGGWEAMQQLDTAVSLVGGPTDLLNELWDGIGAWVA